MRDPAEQLDYWQNKLNTKRWRTAVDSILSVSLLKLVYRSPFATCLPWRFGSLVRARLERGWRNHSNNCNPYAWRLLLGETSPVPEQWVGPIDFACEDAATHLERCKPASFDAFSLSNIADGVPPCYVQRLRMAIDRAARPGAVVVTRSFAKPDGPIRSNLAERDRSMIWAQFTSLRQALHALSFEMPSVSREGVPPSSAGSQLRVSERSFAAAACAGVGSGYISWVRFPCDRVSGDSALAPELSPGGAGRQFLTERLSHLRAPWKRQKLSATATHSAKRRQLPVDGERRKPPYALQIPLVPSRSERAAGRNRVDIRTPGKEADLRVFAWTADAPAPLPAESPFLHPKDARRFAGPLPYTFDYEPETHSIIRIRGVRRNWHPTPVRAEVLENTFLSQEPFCQARPILANTFYVSNVPYRWSRGVRTSLDSI